MYAQHLKQPATLGQGLGLNDVEDCTLTLDHHRVAQLTAICPISHQLSGWREVMSLRKCLGDDRVSFKRVGELD
jgi:hypothetical protein